MFKCSIGNHLSKPGDRAVKVVTEKRIKEYSDQLYDPLTKKPTVIRTGHGWEIAKEVLVCPEHVPQA